MTSHTRIAVLVSIIAFVMLFFGFGIGYEAGVTQQQTLTLTETNYLTQTVYKFTSTSTTTTYIITLVPLQTISAFESRMIIAGAVKQKLSVGPCAKVQLFNLWYWGKYDYLYAKAPPGMKFVVVRMMFRNVADYRLQLREFTEASTLVESPIIVTNTGERYKWSETYDLKWIWIPGLSAIKGMEHLCVEYRELSIYHEFEPGETIVGDIIFIIPKDEKPVEMFMFYRPEAERNRPLKAVIIVKLE